MENRFLYCSKEQFERLLELIGEAGYRLLGPKLHNETIILDRIKTARDLPIGWMDEQDPGHYRVKRREDNAYFGYNLGPHSWKRYLFPSKEKFWSSKKENEHLEIIPEPLDSEKRAFIGVRACEIQGLRILDRVFKDIENYRVRRENTFIVAVNCTRCVNTCFCAAMGSGPKVTGGYDLLLTEVVDDRQHYFVLEVGSEAGFKICGSLTLREASDEEVKTAQAHIERIQEKRTVDNANIHDVLMKNYEHPRWDQVAKRCLNCANCTNVCPTCFCSDTQECVHLDGQAVDRWKGWESCFTQWHSYVAGVGSVRPSARSRYRQWLTHKFGTWWDQFGMSGCVGCGRCITWCPVGIDVTEELAAIERGEQ